MPRARRDVSTAPAIRSFHLPSRRTGRRSARSTCGGIGSLSSLFRSRGEGLGRQGNRLGGLTVPEARRARRLGRLCSHYKLPPTGARSPASAVSCSNSDQPLSLLQSLSGRCVRRVIAGCHPPPMIASVFCARCRSPRNLSTRAVTALLCSASGRRARPGDGFREKGLRLLNQLSGSSSPSYLHHLVSDMQLLLS